MDFPSVDVVDDAGLDGVSFALTLTCWALPLAVLLLTVFQDYSLNDSLVQTLLIASAVSYIIYCYLFLLFGTPATVNELNWVSPEKADQFINCVIETEPKVDLAVRCFEYITTE